jgi:NAD-reducing hydrogenase small subunit
MTKARIATAWLDGCSGCHMSIFDMDERLLDLADRIDIVYGPLVDTKEYPEGVDVVLVEGGIGSEEDRHLAHIMRDRTKIFVSLGDCAVTANIVAYRNPIKVDDVIRRVFAETAEYPVQPNEEVPALMEICRPIHEVIPVDIFIPGCPPSADLIHFVLTELLAGRRPEIKNRFG